MTKPLDSIDLHQTMSREESLERIEKAQRRLTHLRLFAAGLLENDHAGPGIVVVFEGFDAAGKGGSIRRISSALDPRHVRVVPIGPPTPLELAHHFLWRFQESLPPLGGMSIYDRSWYGRVLVERVEGEIDTKQVKRSMVEIVEFERALVESQTIIVKFWLQISADEQLRRFQERKDDPLKHWKLTADDWRNRDKRPAYEEAINDMLQATDHEHSRWVLVPAENKHFARVFVLEQLNRALEHGLERLGYTVPASKGHDYLHEG
jgi:polyphosphate kinase 2 (PPK2 family)